MSATSAFPTYVRTPGSAFAHAEAVTPSNTTELTALARGLWVGGAGNVAVLMADDSTATFSGVAAGTLLPISIKRVNSTSTTATLMVALS